jgi:hypothetical protein
LATCIKRIQGKFGLSYYDFPQLSEWFPKYEVGVDKHNQLTMFQETNYKWEQKDFAKAAAAKKDGTQNMGTELLIMNY